MQITSEDDCKKNLTEQLSVPRETRVKLEQYHDLILKWQNSINLISNSTVNEIWCRHFLDSAQLLPLINGGGGKLLDIGSGAGFPGMVLAMLSAQEVHLVESDTRKATFLKEVARITNTAVTVHNTRMETLYIEDVRIITARACASIEKLLYYVKHLLSDTLTCHFLKGKNWQEEIEDAKKSWKFDYTTTPSLTDPSGVIVSLSNIRGGEGG